MEKRKGESVHATYVPGKTSRFSILVRPREAGHLSTPGSEAGSHAESSRGCPCAQVTLDGRGRWGGRLAKAQEVAQSGPGAECLAALAPFTPFRENVFSEGTNDSRSPL